MTSSPLELESSATPARLRAIVWLEIVLIFFVFFLQGASLAPEANEPHYLGKAKHYWNPDWAAGDFFLQSPDAHHVFYWSIGWLTHFFQLPTVAWIGRLLAWGLLAWAWQRASFALVQRPLASVLSAALFVTLVARYHLAGEWIVGGIEAKVFAYVLVLLALAELIENRWNRVWLLLGGAAAFHVLVGGWSIIAAGFAWLVSNRQLRPTLVQMLPALGGGFLLSLPGLIPALALTSGLPAEVVSQANQIYVFRRLPHHLALHTLAPEELWTRLLRNGPLLAAFLLLGFFVPKDARRHRLLAFIAASILLAVVGFAIGYLTENNPDLSAKLLRYYWFRIYDFALPVGVALWTVLALSILQPRWPRLTAAGLLLLLLLPAWHLSDAVLQRRAKPYPPADRTIRNPEDWRAACDWIRANTPETAVFLTPRMSATFKWYTDRAEVVTQKDIPQDARGIIEWWDRMDRVHRHRSGQQREFRKSLAGQGGPMLQRLGKKYGADYLITRDTQSLAFPLLYRNSTYAVYAIPHSPAP